LLAIQVVATMKQQMDTAAAAACSLYHVWTEGLQFSYDSATISKDYGVEVNLSTTVSQLVNIVARFNVFRRIISIVHLAIIRIARICTKPTSLDLPCGLLSFPQYMTLGSAAGLCMIALSFQGGGANRSFEVVIGEFQLGHVILQSIRISNVDC
jgi:hypothetical protein